MVVVHVGKSQRYESVYEASSLRHVSVLILFGSRSVVGLLAVAIAVLMLLIT